jgi:uncharacterized membrane protein
MAICVVLASAVAVSTMLVRVPIPAPAGYLNFGDIMIFVSALLFGGYVGGFAGGIGSAIADIIGFPAYAPYTLVIKGLEGFLAGSLRDGKSLSRDVVGWAVGASAMVLGYFAAEAYIMSFGVSAALVEVPANLLQVASGGLVGIPIARALRKRIPLRRPIE